MKKTAFIFSALFAFMLLVSCGEKLPSPNEFGFYTDLDAAVANAKKSHKKILLYVTMAGFDEYSEDFTKDVLHSDAYKNLFSKEYVSVHFDFGLAAYEKANNVQTMTEEERKKLEDFNIQIAKNISLARRLDMQYSPAVFFMNEDGYAFADEVYYEDESSGFGTAEKLFSMISEYKEDFDLMQELVDATKKGSAVEKINAINDIYETVDDKYIPTMASLYKQVPEIDQKNESGLVSNLYYIYVMSRAEDFTSVNDFGSAINFITQEIGKGLLEGDSLQYAYFILGNLFMRAGSNNYAEIIGYLTKSVEVDPESELAAQIKIMLVQIEDLISGQNLPEEN